VQEEFRNDCGTRWKKPMNNATGTTKAVPLLYRAGDKLSAVMRTYPLAST